MNLKNKGLSLIKFYLSVWLPVFAFETMFIKYWDLDLNALFNRDAIFVYTLLSFFASIILFAICLKIKKSTLKNSLLITTYLIVYTYLCYLIASIYCMYLGNTWLWQEVLALVVFKWYFYLFGFIGLLLTLNRSSKCK